MKQLIIITAGTLNETDWVHYEGKGWIPHAPTEPGKRRRACAEGMPRKRDTRE